MKSRAELESKIRYEKPGSVGWIREIKKVIDKNYTVIRLWKKDMARFGKVTCGTSGYPEHIQERVDHNKKFGDMLIKGCE